MVVMLEAPFQMISPNHDHWPLETPWISKMCIILKSTRCCMAQGALLPLGSCGSPFNYAFIAGSVKIHKHAYFIEYKNRDLFSLWVLFIYRNIIYNTAELPHLMSDCLCEWLTDQLVEGAVRRRSSSYPKQQYYMLFYFFRVTFFWRHSCNDVCKSTFIMTFQA